MLSSYCVFQLQENIFIEEEGMDVVDVVTGALEQCDVICLMYDSSDSSSFSVAASMMVSGYVQHGVSLTLLSPAQ